jgi:hypothetical protein
MTPSVRLPCRLYASHVASPHDPDAGTDVSRDGRLSLESRISMIALGVRDLPRAVRFYGDGLKFLPSSASTESIAFFKTGGTVLALYPGTS